MLHWLRKNARLRQSLVPQTNPASVPLGSESLASMRKGRILDVSMQPLAEQNILGLDPRCKILGPMNKIWEIPPERRRHPSSENLRAIRRGCGALIDVCENLTQRLPSLEPLNYFTFPAVTTTTRFRSAPKRLSLMIRSGVEFPFMTSVPKLTVEFSADRWSMGFVVGGFNSKRHRNQYWQAVRSVNPDLVKTLRSLSLGQSDTLGAGRANSSWKLSYPTSSMNHSSGGEDQVDIQERRHSILNEPSDSLVVTKKFKGRCPTIQVVLDGVLDAVRTFYLPFEPQFSNTHSVKFDPPIVQSGYIFASRRSASALAADVAVY